MICVDKFGGTSVADIEKIQNVANIIANQRAAGDKVVVVISAMGKTTKSLKDLAHQITDKPNLRELDALLSTGECVSAALLAIALNNIGVPAQSLTAWQLGIITNGNFGDAEILNIKHSLSTFMHYNVVDVITGYQGVTEFGDITTLGFDGSDTTAVAIAAHIKADYCDIYTDVPGVFDKDPNVFKDAKKLDFVSYDDMLKMAQNGANVLHPRSVLTAQKYNIPVRVRGTFTPNDLGTLITRDNRQK